MNCSQTISLSQVLLSVRLAGEPEPELPKLYTEQDMEAARREANQRGFEAASAALESQIVEQREEMTHLQQKILQAFAGHHDMLTCQLRTAIPELTMEIVRRVLGGMEPDQDAISRIVNETLQGIAPGPGMVEVSLCDHDLKLLESYQAGLRERYPQIEFRVDPDLQPGDCIVNSKFGALDGRLATKLRSVDRLFQ